MLDPVLFMAFLLFAIIIFLILYLLNRMQTITSLTQKTEYLSQTLEGLDHQAKLIVKGDMELKLYQEEVEDKLNKLTLLKNLILSSINILDREDLFSQISEKTILDLGFKKGLILNYEDLENKLNLGFAPQEIDAVKKFLLVKKKIFSTTPLLCADSEGGKILADALKTKDFIVAPLKARETVHALLIVAAPVLPAEIRPAEKSALSIIGMYLGQCLDNIKMFEELYMAKDDLEKKVKERTNELVKSLRDIETISKTKTDFISSVSHELRTPLTSVKGFSSLLIAEKFGQLPPEAKKRLEKIDENVNKLVDMVNMLLDIARIESGKTEVKIAPADIAKLMRDTSDFLTPQMQAKQISLSLNAPESIPVFMDKNLIERVLINLINNALKFTPLGGKINLACKINGPHAIISVADTGCGIPKEDMPKLFQEFYRSRLTQNIQGTGLGLSLVKRIIDTHKEKIWIESEVDKGTTFYFNLKLAEKESRNV